jgi:phosphohistidine phosphatase SixA
MIYLIRHAHAGYRSGDGADDASRGLSPRGRAEAESIAAHLSSEPLSRIFSSPHVRCVETVAALAAATGLEVETDPRLAEGASSLGAEALLRTAGQGSVLCTHGDVVAYLIGFLKASGVAIEGSLLWEKGSMWELALDGSRGGVARYIPPPSV